MLQLSEKQAQDIVDKMMQDIPYNINIMNEQGIIMGSGQKERVGTIHQGAVRALTTGSMIEVWQDGILEKMGTNEPILINQQHVGVIGISGHPDEVRPFCNIVRTTVSLLIEQRNQLESMAHEASRQKAFIERLLNQFGSYSQKVKKEALQYRIDLHIANCSSICPFPHENSWPLTLRSTEYCSKFLHSLLKVMKIRRSS